MDDDVAVFRSKGALLRQSSGVGAGGGAEANKMFYNADEQRCMVDAEAEGQPSPTR